MTIWFGEPLVDAERMDPTDLETTRARGILRGYNTISGVQAELLATFARGLEARAAAFARPDSAMVRAELAQLVRVERAMVAAARHREWELAEAAFRGVQGAAL